MENFDWMTIAIAVLGSGVVVSGLVWGLKYLRGIIVESENKIDDAVWAAVTGGTVVDLLKGLAARSDNKLDDAAVKAVEEALAKYKAEIE